MSKLPFFIAITAAVIALGFFVYVTDAPAYGGSAPETCANCHVMDSQYENWYHAPHEKFTECVDCHLPHENVVAYYLEKGRQGAKDVYAFTTGNMRSFIDHIMRISICKQPVGQPTRRFYTGMRYFGSIIYLKRMQVKIAV